MGTLIVLCGCAAGQASVYPRRYSLLTQRNALPAPTVGLSVGPCLATFTCIHLFLRCRSVRQRTHPNDAYRFALGETVMLPPLNSAGQGTRPARISRPLDFLGVTDHGDYLGEVSLCSLPGSPAYMVGQCVAYRDPNGGGAFGFGVGLAAVDPIRNDVICGLKMLIVPQPLRKDGRRFNALQNALRPFGRMPTHDVRCLRIHKHSRCIEPPPQHHLSQCRCARKAHHIF